MVGVLFRDVDWIGDVCCDVFYMQYFKDVVLVCKDGVYEKICNCISGEFVRLLFVKVICVEV